MRLRVSLLGVDEVGELCGVADEEDGGIVEDHIPVTFICAEFDGEPTRVASSICRARLSTYS